MRTDPSPLPLARGYPEFLTALSIAAQRAQMYPDGHPSLDQAIDLLVPPLDHLLEEHSSVAFTVGPGQLFVEDSATDAAHGPHRDLATRLFRRNVGMVRLARGTTRPELMALIAALSGEQNVSVTHSSSHVEVQPLHFESLVLDTGDPDLGEAAEEPAEESYWAELGQAFDSSAPDPARDSAVLQYLVDAIETCRNPQAPRATTLRGYAGRLLRELRPETMDRLFSLAQRAGLDHRFLLDLVQLASAPLALDLMLAASRVERRSMSPALVQLLTKLASHAESGPRISGNLAAEQLREAVLGLISGWDEADLPDETAVEYEETLSHLPAPLDPDLDPTEAYRSDPYRILTMHLDMGELGQAAGRAVRTLVARGRIRPLVRLLDELAPGDARTAAFLPLIATPDALSALLAARPVDLETLERLAPEVGTAAIPPLLDGLAASAERSVRRRLLELLARFGDAVTPAALARLEGAEWFVQRNLLRLLQMLPNPPAEAVASGFAQHDDPRVRVEGLRLLLRHPAARPRGIVQGLADGDPSCVRVVVTAALEDCPAVAVPPLLRRLLEGPLDPELRSPAIRAVAPRVEEPAVLELLLALASRRVPLLGRFVAAKNRDSLAALGGLARHWRWHPRAGRLLARAERHRDPEIRAAVAAPSVLEQLGIEKPAP